MTQQSQDEGEDWGGERWEYKTLPLEPKGVLEGKIALEERLNELGDEGWELEGTVPMERGPGSTALALLILKREYRDGE